jgi:hypothetical protein
MTLAIPWLFPRKLFFVPAVLQGSEARGKWPPDDARERAVRLSSVKKRQQITFIIPDLKHAQLRA